MINDLLPNGILVKFNEKRSMGARSPGRETTSRVCSSCTSPMKDPYTVDDDRVMISTPTYSWEKNGSAVNEGPEILTNSAG